jgi:hypothetical protein
MTKADGKEARPHARVCSANRARRRTWFQVSRRSDESRANASRVNGSGSLAFPAPSFTLTVTGRVFEVFPCSRPPPEGCNRARAALFHQLVVAFPARRGLRGRERPADHLSPWRSLVAPHAGAAKPPACTSARRDRPHPATPSRLLLEVPSVDHRVGCPLPAPCRNSAPSAPRCHPRRSRSALVVSHHLDGFLQPDGAGVVAARNRPWGSPCFPTRPPGPRSLKRRSSRPGVPHDAHTPRRCSLSAAPAPSPRDPEEPRVHGRRCPLAVMPASGLCSTDRSLVPVPRFQRPATLSFHGLLLSLGSPDTPRRGWRPEIQPAAEAANPGEITSKNGTEVPSPR